MTTSLQLRLLAIDKIVASARTQTANLLEPSAEAEFLGGYFAHASSDDLTQRPPDELAALATAHLAFGLVRPADETLVGVSAPGRADEGASTVIRIVTGDRPFLVDTVAMTLTRADWSIRSIFHPQLAVHRDPDGALLGLAERPTGTAESWICVEAFPPLGSAAGALAEGLRADLAEALGAVAVAVADWDAMQDRVVESEALLNRNPQPVSPQQVGEATALLTWLRRDNFVFLGYREYRVHGGRFESVPGTGLGLLRGDGGDDTSFHAVPGPDEREVLVVTKDSRRSPVQRPVHLDYVGVRVYVGGELVGERRFLGLLSASAYREPIERIPMLAAKADWLLAASGFERHSHGGNVTWHVLSTYPRDELFLASAEELEPVVSQVVQFEERRLVRVFVRRERHGRFFSCLVYLPRDRHTTRVRLRIQEILLAGLGGESLEYQTAVTGSILARLFFVVKRPDGDPHRGAVDVEALQAEVAAAARNWDDEFEEAARGLASEDRGVEFSDAYTEEFPAELAVADLRLANGLAGDESFAYQVYRPFWEGDPADLRFKVIAYSQMSLTDVMPHLSLLGVEVIDERPYEWELRGRKVFLFDFGLRLAGGAAAADAWNPELERRFIDAFDATYHGRAESGRFNRLVMTAGLTWEEVTWLRSISRYLIQAGIPFSQTYIASALTDNAPIAAALVAAFRVKFDPSLGGDEAARSAAVAAAYDGIEEQLVAVASLDHDRILRTFLAVLRAMVRTNAFQPDAPAIAFKVRPRDLALLPEPRPVYEIFVYSPRVQGVHLRFGKVARGGLRWSDRKEDFRTEVLGLVKAQMVKNTVIVPTGAKGGFVPQALPDPALDRAAWLAEGIACYQIFVTSLLTLTDNIVAGEVVAPPNVVRYDDDDPYLVVAADKGTATFSDIANAISLQRGHWLGDAFASGGSVGYDHKGMGITARGAWESVKRHFIELGRDCQREDFTCVGIGDMAGDVFGNGMLLSRHTRLVAAFNHLHVFLDPDPDAAASFEERQRLFVLPRSSWADYDATLISAGGGVYPRSLKAIPVSPQARRALGIADTVTQLTPNELIHAILQAPVDLLWNGGIGTYVKGSDETDAQVGDKANDAVRVNGAQVRATVAGEGGNLGWTQRGRVEYALTGGRLNTDFIDNSAGVDTSDHEVNIKILLDDQVAAGALTLDERHELLASMTDEVARLVLSHNIDQNLALSNGMAREGELAGAHEGWMRTLTELGYLDRGLEYLPDSAEMARRMAEGRGLTRPELSTMLAYTKIFMKDQVLASDLPEDPYLADRLIHYFPTRLQERYADAMPRHRLAREIITTVAVNRFVNSQGVTAFHRLNAETGAGVTDVIRAQLAARTIFAVGRSEVALGRMDDLAADLATELRMSLRRKVERATRWLLANRRSPLDITAAGAQFTEGVKEVNGFLAEVVTERQRARGDAAVARWLEQGVPPAVAREAAITFPHMALTIVEIAGRTGAPLRRVAEVYFGLVGRLGLDQLFEAIVGLSQGDRWSTMARAALRDDLLGVQDDLATAVLTAADPALPAADVVAAWAAATPGVAERRAMLQEICEAPDVARLSVGVRQVRSLLSV